MDQLEQLGESWTEAVEFGIFGFFFPSFTVYVENDSSWFCELGSVHPFIDPRCQSDFLSL